jgi:DNA-directed RNA polymerase specialized sigma24 family protein
MKRAEELALARRVATGDATALRDFYDRYADILFAFVCHSLGGPRADAEEVWQDTLVAGIEALPSYRAQADMFQWLCPS